MLAPQRGLIATGKSKNNGNLDTPMQPATENCKDKIQLPETSNFDCLPGKAGGPPCFARLLSLADRRALCAVAIRARPAALIARLYMAGPAIILLGRNETATDDGEPQYCQ